MSQSTLIYGENKKGREKKIFEGVDNISSPDVIVIECLKDKKSIGIDQVREGIKFLTEKPFELDVKYLLIPEAYKLTIPAQNAMLKTLEEPPTYGVIRLGSKSEEDLLETVISRCTRISVRSGEVGESEEKRYNYNSVINMTIGERLDLVSVLSKEEKEDILEILENWIVEERKIMESTNRIKILLSVREDMELNINTKLALEYLAINLE